MTASVSLGYLNVVRHHFENTSVVFRFRRENKTQKYALPSIYCAVKRIEMRFVAFDSIERQETLFPYVMNNK